MITDQSYVCELRIDAMTCKNTYPVEVDGKIGDVDWRSSRSTFVDVVKRHRHLGTTFLKHGGHSHDIQRT